MNRFPLILILIATAVVGCAERDVPRAQRAPKSSDNDGMASDTIETQSETVARAQKPPGWNELLGKRVTLTGKAIDHKIGAVLYGDGFTIDVDLPETYWPSELYHGGDNGELVRVTGTVAQRADLPVFIPDPNQPSIAGMPVPKGTDLKEAAKRYILESVEWERVNSAVHISTSKQPHMKTIIYRGGIVRFRIPTQWAEEYADEGGATFYEAHSDSPTLRLNVLTFKSPRYVDINTPSELLRSRAEKAKCEIVRLDTGNAMIAYHQHAEEDGEPLVIHFWELANVVPPGHGRLAIFSLTVLASEQFDPEIAKTIQMVDREVAACEFGSELGL